MMQAFLAVLRWQLMEILVRVNMDIYKQLCDIVTEENVLMNELMSGHSTFKAGGPADFYVTPEKTAQVVELVRLCETTGIAYHIHGNGSNVLFSDSGYRGVIISIGRSMSSMQISDGVIHAEAGVTLAALAAYAAKNCLTGLEFASGIPGTLGGAVTMNAGAYGGEMKDVLVSVTVCDRAGNIKTLQKEELQLGYRTSIIQKEDYIVLGADMKLTAGDAEEIRATMNELNSRRREKQPLEYGSAGSTFKRPEGHFAGQLIEESGLKGYRVGDAMVSEKHAGFVVNVENATAEDILSVIRHVQKEVKLRFNIELETEVKLIGFEK